MQLCYERHLTILRPFGKKYAQMRHFVIFICYAEPYYKMGFVVK